MVLKYAVFLLFTRKDRPATQRARAPAERYFCHLTRHCFSSAVRGRAPGLGSKRILRASFLKMHLVTNLVVLCDRFRPLTHKYAFIRLNILSLTYYKSKTFIGGPDQLAPRAGCSPRAASCTTPAGKRTASTRY